MIKTMISSLNGPRIDIYLLDLRYDWAIRSADLDGYIRVI